MDYFDNNPMNIEYEKTHFKNWLNIIWPIVTNYHVNVSILPKDFCINLILTYKEEITKVWKYET